RCTGSERPQGHRHHGRPGANFGWGRGRGGYFARFGIGVRSVLTIATGAQTCSQPYNFRMQADELLKKALALPDHERAELAGSLLDSLDPVVDEDAEASWQIEVSRRLHELETGKIKTIPWDEVRKKGRSLLGQK